MRQTWNDYVTAAKTAAAIECAFGAVETDKTAAEERLAILIDGAEDALAALDCVSPAYCFTAIDRAVDALKTALRRIADAGDFPCDNKRRSISDAAAMHSEILLADIAAEISRYS